MPSPIAHFSMGAALWVLWDQHGVPQKPVTRLQRLTGFACFLGASMLPDLDAVPGFLTGEMHRYHNQGFHSLFACVLVSALAGWIAGPLLRCRFSVEVFGIASISYFLHLLMDTFTQGRGVRLFWPVYSERMQAPFEVFGGLRWSEGIWYRGHWVTIFEELLFASVLGLVVMVVQRKSKFRLKQSKISV